jgi:hypothetical protein
MERLLLCGSRGKPVIYNTLNSRSIAVIAILLAVSALSLRADVEDASEDSSGPSKAIITKYLQATNHQAASHSMEVEINASVPRLQEHGKLWALRSISKVGLITYRVLGFQGDNTVKKEVIGRYLQAEQQSQSNPGMLLTPANYKFKLKGEKTQPNGEIAYMFQVSPRKKRVGLFKGELWLDSKSYLPVLEKGRLVKTPSIFFKKVDFERAFAIQNGASVPAHMSSTINTRVVGIVELDINYTPVSETDDDAAAGELDTASIASPSLR